MTAEKNHHKKDKVKSSHKKRTNDETNDIEIEVKAKSLGNKKLKQPGTEKRLLDFYWKLASDDAKERLDAAIGLLKGLSESDSEENWKYAYERLLKGLSSSRGSARLGFSMALSEVLNARKEFIDVWTYLDMVSENFYVPTNVSGHEERGLNFGTLFALRTLAQSPLMLKSSTTIREYERFLDILLELSKRKVWLRESVFFALCELLKKLNSEESELGFNFKNAIEITLKKVHENGITLTSEGVALYLSIDEDLRSEYPINGGWKNNDPLLSGNLAILAKALKEVSVDDDNEDGEKTKLKGNWKPTLHFVWELLIHELNGKSVEVKKDESKKAIKKKKDNIAPTRLGFEEFWKTVIDESLFANSASNERKYWGFEIFTLFLQRISSQNIKFLFSPNFIRCLINQLSQPDRFLNKAAKKVVSSIQETVTHRPDISLDVIDGLLQKVPNFDTITKTKTVSSLILVVPGKDLDRLVDSFNSVFIETKETEEKAIELRRQWALDNLLNLVKTRRTEPEAPIWIEKIISLLVRFGFFKGLGPDISTSTIDTCHSRLNSVLSLTVGSARNDNRSWAFYVLNSILSLEEDGKELLNDFEGDLLKAKNKSIKTLEKIRKKRSSSTHADTSQLEAFELLFSLVLIQVYSTDSEAAGVLDELQMCYNTIIGKSRNQEGDDEEDIDATQVLTEILLSFLSRRSALLRRLSETVWGTFTSQITKESLQLLYDVLETSESAHGQEGLFDNDDDDMDIDEDDENGGDDESEDEESEDEEDEEDEEEEEEDDEDEDEDEDDDDDAVKEADRQAHEALAKALGINQGEHESESLDEDDDDDESMDDEQMMALDEQLAGIFKERQKVLNTHKTPTQKKQDAMEAKQNMVQFKSRVLDLLEIYIKSQPSNPFLLTAIPALLTVIRITKDIALGDKAHQLLRNKLCKVKELPKLSSEDIESAFDILSSVHAQAKRSTNKPHSLACNQTSVFISKILLSHDKNLAERVGAVYASSLTEWMKASHSKITPALFFDIVNYIASTKNRNK